MQLLTVSLLTSLELLELDCLICCCVALHVLHVIMAVIAALLMFCIRLSFLFAEMVEKAFLAPWQVVFLVDCPCS